MNIKKELEQLQVGIIVSLKQKMIAGEATSADISNAIKLLKDNGVSLLMQEQEDFAELEDIVIPALSFEKEEDEVKNIELEMFDKSLNNEEGVIND